MRYPTGASRRKRRRRHDYKTDTAPGQYIVKVDVSLVHVGARLVVVKKVSAVLDDPVPRGHGSDATRLEEPFLKREAPNIDDPRY
jgi:hypothetical protein